MRNLSKYLLWDVPNCLLDDLNVVKIVDTRLNAQNFSISLFVFSQRRYSRENIFDAASHANFRIGKVVAV